MQALSLARAAPSVRPVAALAGAQRHGKQVGQAATSNAATAVRAMVSVAWGETVPVYV